MSERITVTLPDGSSREFDRGATAADVAASIGKRLAKDALAAKADGEWIDLARPLDGDTNLEIVTPAERGCQLSLRIASDPKGLLARLQAAGVVCDFREPDVIRAAPTPPRS